MFMEVTCTLQNVAFINVWRKFDPADLLLWKKKDQVHLSSDYGLPLLISLLLSRKIELCRQQQQLQNL